MEVAQIQASVLTRRAVSQDIIDGASIKIHPPENTDENLQKQFRQ
jgi:hypothetical protein